MARFSIPAVLAAALIGLSGLAGPASAQDIGERALRVDGRERAYLLYVPDEATGPVPLVIALHGGGGNARTMLPRWLETARREGFAVAFPEGLGRMPSSGTWNAGGCCAYAMNEDIDDVGFMAAILDELGADPRIDASRIYMTGLSNGGMLTHRAAIALGPRLAGIAVVAGAMFGGEPQAASGLPVVIIHGEQDEIVPFNGGQSPMRLVAQSQSRPFESATYAADYWRTAGGCGPTPVTARDGDITTETYAGCAEGSEVVLYRLHSAGHTWPGSAAASVSIERQAYDRMDATAVIWSFFERHSRD